MRFVGSLSSAGCCSNFVRRDFISFSAQQLLQCSTGLVDLYRFGYKDVLYVGVPRYLAGGMGSVGFFSPSEDAGGRLIII